MEELRGLLPFAVPEWAFKSLLVLLLISVLLPTLMNWSPLLRLVRRGLGWRPGKRPDKRRTRRRALFADHVESQMRRLGEKEEWRDSRYAELEAELEIVGARESGVLSLLRRRSATTLRRVPSLSVALEKNGERIILLEGEPGAGKSVAMRHLAQRMARGARQGVGTIPIYVNLKTFCPTDAVPTSDNIRDFVLDSINQVRDRDVLRFLEDEFQSGLQEGTWLFLFDSFDEIPAILSATEADAVIASYADALHGFLHGMNRCRGVVASREFRGPGRRAWPTFRVVPLSQERKVDLIEKTDLRPAVEQMLLADLPTAEASVQQMSDNPLFLSLLCEHMREGNDLPANVHAVLETYVGHRLVRDADLVQGYFGTTHDEVRVVAEELAFIMAGSLGLTVPKTKAVELVAASLQRDPVKVDQAVEALKYTKLARSNDDESTVTFSHRRLQEYFATCVVIRDPDRVPVRSLLTDGRWRETAVTVLQTQDPTSLLAEALLQLPEVDPEAEAGIGSFTWPPGMLYLLGILAEGCTPAILARSAPEIPRRVGLILRQAWEHGQRYDQKWALESCSAADRDSYLHLVTNGFASESEWLRQESYAQIRKVPDIVDDVAAEVRQTLVDMAADGKLRRQRASVLSQIRRLPDPSRFLPTYRILLIAPVVNLVLAILLLGLISSTGYLDLVMGSVWYGLVVTFTFLMIPFYAVQLGIASMPSKRRRVKLFGHLIEFADELLLVVGFAFPAVYWFGVVKYAYDREEFVEFTPVVLGIIPMIICVNALVVARNGLRGSVFRSFVVIIFSPFSEFCKSLGGIVFNVRQGQLRMGLVLVVAGAFVVMHQEWIVRWIAPFLLLIMATSFTVAFSRSVFRFVRYVLTMFSEYFAVRRRLADLLDGTDADGLWCYLRSVRTAWVVEFFLAGARKRDIDWSPESMEVLVRVAARMRHVESRGAESDFDDPVPPLPEPSDPAPQWLHSSEVLDALSMLISDSTKKDELAVRPTPAAVRAGRG
ncbi:MAG: NACHT domain-containing protein [Umezawaea sp.]